MKISTKTLTGMAMLAALSVVSLLVVQFPIFSAVPFMKYDVADIFIFLGTFMFGPLAGLVITAVVSLIQGFLMGGDGVVGALMHFLATGTFSLVAGFIYRKNHNIKGAIVSLVVGFFAWVGVMILADLLVIPMFMSVSVEVVVGLLPILLAFNVIKAGINSVLTFILYKHVHKFFKFIGAAEKNANDKKERTYDFENGTVILSSSYKETLHIAQEFAKKLNLGDTVLLSGDLGAGKTVFARGIIQNFVDSDVLSPTFNILKEYADGKICHFDMYRIESEEELENLGFEEYFSQDRLCIVEWNRIENIYGTIYRVNIEVQGKKRKITVKKEEVR